MQAGQQVGQNSLEKQFTGSLPFIGESQESVDMQIAKTDNGFLGVRCVHNAKKPSPHLTTSHIESAAHVMLGAKGVAQVFADNPKYRENMQAVHLLVYPVDADIVRIDEVNKVSTLIFRSEETYQMIQNGGVDFSEDRIVTKAALEGVMRGIKDCPVALIEFKGHEQTIHHWPYLTNEAVAYLIGKGVEVVCLNIPSIDRESDGGLASNHKIVFADQNRLVVESLSLEKVQTGKMQILLNPGAFGEDPDVVGCKPTLI